MKEPTQDQSLVAAIEGDFNGMSRNDLILTCQMLTRGREIWRKQCEAAEAKLDEPATRTPSPELVELRRDKERLDWLETYMFPEKLFLASTTNGISRAAIDVAKEKNKT